MCNAQSLRCGKKMNSPTFFSISIFQAVVPVTPLSRFEDWDIAWSKWLKSVTRWNENPESPDKKYVFFICHSFQLASRFFNAGIVWPRKSTAFGVFPVHMLEAGKQEPVFDGLRDPFYAVDSRDYQVIQPNHDLLQKVGGRIPLY